MGKKHRPGGQGVESTFTEETSELSLESKKYMAVSSCNWLIHMPVQILHLTNNYNSVTFSVSMST